MMYDMPDMLVHWWHKVYGNNHPMSDLIKDPLHDVEPIPNAA